jgi:outer membrane biosynthesis protein TonB
MNKKLILPALGLAFLSASCGGNQETKETVVTDTVVKTETVVVQAPIDSAAIVAYYEAAHAKAKGKHQETHATHAETKKKVRVDSHEPIEHHDAMNIPAAAETAPAQAATEAPSTQSQPVVLVLHDTETFYFRPDEKASFPGGEKAFDQYIMKNIKYPSEAVNFGVTGTVHAIMYLDENGKVSKVEFAGKEIGYGLEAETRRLLMNSPRWNPAKHNGNAVKSKFALPVTFELNG